MVHITHKQKRLLTTTVWVWAGPCSSPSPPDTGRPESSSPCRTSGSHTKGCKMKKIQKMERLVSQLADLAREVTEEYGGTVASPEAGYACLLKHFPHLLSSKREKFVAVFLDGRRQVVGAEVISVGTLTATLVHPREVFRPAILAGAGSILVCHNHPSGNPNPSAEDRLLTERLAQAARLLGITLDDHIIVGKEGYVSLRQLGLMPIA